jgi:hypothetical protein
VLTTVTTCDCAVYQAKDDADAGVEEEAVDKTKGGAAAAAKGKEERVYYGPRVKEGEHVFGIAHIYASFNDTFVVRQRDPDRERRSSARHCLRRLPPAHLCCLLCFFLCLSVSM